METVDSGQGDGKVNELLTMMVEQAVAGAIIPVWGVDSRRERPHSLKTGIGVIQSPEFSRGVLAKRPAAAFLHPLAQDRGPVVPGLSTDRAADR